MSLEKIVTIKHSSDTGGSTGSGGSSGAGDGGSGKRLNTVKLAYRDLIDGISDSYATIYADKESGLVPIDKAKISEVNGSYSSYKLDYERIFNNMLYSDLSEIKDCFRKNIAVSSLLEETKLPAEAQKILESLILADSAKSPGALNPLEIRSEENRNDFYEALEYLHRQADLETNFLKNNDRNRVNWLINQISSNSGYFFRNEIHKAIDKRLNIIKPTDIPTLEALKINSYLLGIADEIDGYSSQILEIFDKEFEESKREEIIFSMNENLASFRKFYSELSDPKEKEKFMERFPNLVDPQNPGYITSITKENIEEIYLEMFSIVESLSSIQQLLTKILTNSKVDAPTVKKSRPTHTHYESVIVNPTTQKSLTVKTSLIPRKIPQSDARIRLTTLDPNSAHKAANVRLDINKFGTTLDLDCGIISILIPSSSQNAKFTYHHDIEGRTKKDAERYGIKLPFRIIVSDEIEDPNNPGIRVPHFDRLCARFDKFFEAKFTNIKNE